MYVEEANNSIFLSGSKVYCFYTIIMNVNTVTPKKEITVFKHSVLTSSFKCQIIIDFIYDFKGIFQLIMTVLFVLKITWKSH